MLIYIICGILILGIIAQIISAVIEKKEGASISGLFFVRQFFAITAVLCFGVVSGYCLDKLRDTEEYVSKGNLEKVLQFFYFLTPYARINLEDERLVYALNISGIFLLIEFVLMLRHVFSKERKEFLSGLILSVILVIGLWYFMLLQSYFVRDLPMYVPALESYYLYIAPFAVVLANGLLLYLALKLIRLWEQKFSPIKDKIATLKRNHRRKKTKRPASKVSSSRRWNTQSSVHRPSNERLEYSEKRRIEKPERKYDEIEKKNAYDLFDDDEDDFLSSLYGDED